MVLPFLDLFGLDPAGVKSVIGKGDDVRYMMLKMGYADLFVTHSQELIRKVGQDGDYYVIPDPSDGRSMDARVVTASLKAIKKRGQAVEKFVDALRCAVNSAAENPEKVARLLSDEYGYTRDEASAYAVRFASSARGQDFVPSAAAAAGFWRFVDESTDADRASTAKFLFPDYARKAFQK